MTKRTSFLMWIVAGMVVARGAQAQQPNSAPVVRITQVSLPPEYPNQVLINYNLADDDGDRCTVWVNVSDDGGVSWRVPARTFVGDVTRPGQRLDIAPGESKWIRWDAGADVPGAVGNYRFRVWAEDGKGLTEMVLVSGGPFPYHNTTPWISIPNFIIDKYEVTNEQYCHFLNNRQAGDNDDHWNAGQSISRSTEQPYYYTVIPGKERYPICQVSKIDASHFAQWRSQVEGAIYRLPTEQEWEKAAAWDPIANGGAGRYWTYGFQGDTLSCDWCTYAGCGGSPREVGYFRADYGRNDAKSFYGCYDMTGNLFEWTNNNYFRGGDYGTADWQGYLRCASDGSHGPDTYTYVGLGFRLILDPTAN